MSSEDRPQKTLRIGVDLNALINRLSLGVQRTMNLVAVGLTGGKRLEDAPIQLPDTHIGLQIASDRQWDLGFARNEHEKWVLACGFRDVSEATGAFLEEVHSIVALWSLGDQSKTMTGADLEKKTVAEPESFQGLGLPKKLERLRDQYSLMLDPGYVSHVLSINAARNCLVHRRGIVADWDCKAGEGLIVTWTRLSIRVCDGKGDRELYPPGDVEAEGGLNLKREPACKTFQRGESVVFTVNEFSEICWTLYQFGISTAQLLDNYSDERGIKWTG